MTDRDRMPPLAAERMTTAQQEAVREIVAGPRGQLSGPFIPALRSPEFMRRLQALGEYLRYQHALPAPLREMVILLTAREWTQQYEWHIHAPIALAAGLPAAVIEAIAAGTRPVQMTADEALVHDFFVELQRRRSISDALYARAVARFGEQAVVDLVGAVGYYTTLAMLMNVARSPLPPGAQPGLRPFPE